MSNLRLQNRYETVAVSQTDQAMGTAGAAGDKIYSIVATVITSGANGTLVLTDGSTAYTLVPASTPLGVHTINFGIAGITSATGAWKVTTGSACTAVVTGEFSK